MDSNPDAVGILLIAAVCGLIAWHKAARLHKWEAVRAVCIDERAASSQFAVGCGIGNPGNATIAILTKPTWWRYSVDGDTCFVVKNPLDKKSRKVGDVGVAHVNPDNPGQAAPPGEEASVGILVGCSLFCVVYAAVRAAI